MNRSLKLSVLTALALGSAHALALDLGHMRVMSTLGEPLRVEIPVIPASPADLQNLSARLASDAAFARAEVADAKPSVPLNFAIVDDHGRKAILITSTEPVNNPYIDLLIDVSSAAGSSVHEYPLLLDPPGEGRTAAAVSPRYQVPQPAALPPAYGSRAMAPRSLPPSPAVRSGGYVSVQRGQTLYGIASRAMPQGVSLDQMLLALQQANPDAFYRANINALKSGAVLRVPSREQALAQPLAEAAAAVRRQDSDWRSGVAPVPTTVAAGATRAGASVSPTGRAGGGDRLALVPAGSEGVGGSGLGRHASTAKLRQALERSQASLASLQQQTADLNSRLKALQDINSKSQRLLALKNDEIAQLQAQLNAARKAAGLPPAKPVAPAVAGSSAPVVAVAPQAKGAAAQTPPAGAGTAGATQTKAPATVGKTSRPTVPAKPAANKPVHPMAPAHREPEQPWYTQSWAMLAGAVVVVLALLGLLISRRRRSRPAPSPARPTTSLADQFGDALLPADGSADPEQDELLDQLAEHPDDIGLHLELVSLYYSRRDVEHFEAAAEAMHAHIASPEQPEWQDVVHMGEDLTPGHPLFAHAGDAAWATPHGEAAPAHAGDDRTVLRDFGMDRHAGEAVAEDAAPEPLPPPLGQNLGEYHFDFNLAPHAPSDEHDAPATAHVPYDDAAEFTEPHVEAHDAVAAAHAGSPEDHLGEFGTLSDDPVDTKLDLARAYLDMGDPEGARAMLDEVMQEGSQVQKDMAKGLLERLS